MQPGILLLIAFVSILTLGILVFLRRDNRSSKGSEGGIIVLFFIVMAFFLWKSTDSPSPSDNEDNAEYVTNKGNVTAENPHIAVIGAKDTTVTGGKSIFDSGVVKGIYVGLMAFLPVVIYLLFVILSDDTKPEPVPVLLLAVLLGSILAIVAKSHGLTLNDCRLSINNDIANSLDIGFVRIAIPSEVAKWLILLVFLAINKYYDEYLDGIVYSVSISMGFACILCVGYMIHLMGYTSSTFYLQGLVTSFVLAPLNMMVGVIMGYFVALSKHRNRLLNYALSLVLPIIASGVLYSILAFLDNVLWHYLVFVLTLTPLSFVIYRQMWHLMELDAKRSQAQIHEGRF